MLGEEYCTILLPGSPAVLQWYSRKNGWNAQDYSSQNAQTSKSRERMVVYACRFAGRMMREREYSEENGHTLYSVNWLAFGIHMIRHKRSP